MKRVVAIALVMTSVVLATGCRRSANSEATFRVEPNTLKATELPSAKAIVADYSSSDNVPVSAYLVKTEDANTALDAIEKGKTVREAMASIKVLAEQPKQTSGKFTSPRTEDAAKYSILFTSEKPTTVTVKTKGG